MIEQNDIITEFNQEVTARIKSNKHDESLKQATQAFMQASIAAKYSYNFSWAGRPIIQYPQDLIALQEIIWRIQPDLIIETGVAHGGSSIFYASMLELIGKGECFFLYCPSNFHPDFICKINMIAATLGATRDCQGACRNSSP